MLTDLTSSHDQGIPVDPADATIITVAFNSEAVLPAMLASKPKSTPAIVVDNASSDPIAIPKIAKNAPRTSVHRNDRNFGFGVGCNIGAQAVKTPYILFLNPDASLQEGAIEALLLAARKHPQAAAFNPRIFSDSGKLILKRRSQLLPRREWHSRNWPDGDCVLPVLYGAAVFISKQNFDRVGGFDPAIFLYHEDDDISLRLRREVGELMLASDAKVQHLKGRSLSRSPETAAFKAFYMGRSRVYTRAKHGFSSPFFSSLAAAVAQLMSPDTLLSKRKRSKRMGFVKGVFSTWRDSGASGRSNTGTD
ncbi:MAG: glycosyltransferase family 2 protein [Pseudomonadota bacterium]